MKNTTKTWNYLFAVIAAFLMVITSCTKKDSTDTTPVNTDPYGMFTYTIKSNGIVSFTNTSTNATSYLWDFGDLTTSTSSEVSFDHKYLQNGVYKATLTAYGNGKSAGAYANLNITSAVSETVTDIDGNVYHLVTIGTQVWMVENLKTTKYRNGDPIHYVTDNAAWADLTTGAYCNYGNDANNSTTYGRLYNWYSVSDSRNIAPTGYHVPTDAEWTTLTTYLGGVSVAGGKLKETGTAHWQSPNEGATNETGFTALPTGYRSNGDGAFYNFGGYGYWWSSSFGGNLGAWDLCMFYDDINVVRGSNYITIGNSVRCLRD